MRCLLSVALLLLSPAAFSQTTLDITLPDHSLCSYATGPVTNGLVAGHLQATATSSTGNCGASSAGSLTFGPAQPAAASPSNLNANSGSSNISFQLVNTDVSTQCTGSISPSTNTSFNGGSILCTGTACQNPVTRVANFDNESTTQGQTYTVSVICTGATGSATSTTSVVATAKGTSGGGSCASIPNQTGGVFTRLTGNVSIDHLGAGTVTGDITSFNAFFGTVSHPNWPGSYGQVSRVYVPESNYVSLQFDTGNFFTGSNAGSQGNYTIVESTSGYTAPVSESISTSCGDFSNPAQSGSTVICRKNALGANGAIGWTSATGSACMIENNKTYYWNFINADISNVTPTGGSAVTTANSKCSNGKCFDGFYNKLGTWSN